MSAVTELNIWTALMEIQADPPQVFKDARGQYGTYLSLGNLMDAIQPVLTSKGVVLTQIVNQMEGQPALFTRLYHVASETFVEGNMLLMSSQANPQQQGSAITYARRYSLVSMLGLVADEDDDGQVATNAASRALPQPKGLSGAMTADDGNMPQPATPVSAW